ncbi:putative glutaredoxin [Cardiosporidium cionae]|uniref:Glutaredoxin n=1 Tax=Cardiosporidium cionae TaxID=476202 RepID=A0ABQ7J9H5_9APIC|nr:putative glutaredoxin [Cardiosporidium cionae]|eukprot:KAF8820620.1 putative glutaredoxin [Cardiosporidium cionae]
MGNTNNSSSTPKMVSADTKNLVDSAISDNDVMVFSKTGCPYCRKAIMAINELNPKGLNVLQIENLPDMAGIQDYLKEKTGGRSVPRVFIKGEFLGGGDETARAKQDGTLKSKFIEIGAL